MKITIENLQRTIPISPTRILRTARKILLFKKVRRAELSIAFVTDQRIKALNKKFLKREYTTDVLSFDLREKPRKDSIEGEIIISTATAKRNAKAYGQTVAHEIDLYLIHGTLHLLGFDDHAHADIARMRREEMKILKVLGYDR